VVELEDPMLHELKGLIWNFFFIRLSRFDPKRNETTWEPDFRCDLFALVTNSLNGLHEIVDVLCEELEKQKKCEKKENGVRLKELENGLNGEKGVDLGSQFESKEWNLLCECFEEEKLENGRRVEAASRWEEISRNEKIRREHSWIVKYALKRAVKCLNGCFTENGVHSRGSLCMEMSDECFQ